jgi:hypothetical protein
MLSFLLDTSLSVIYALFVWLIRHQSAVLFSHNKPAANNYPTVLFSQNKPAPTTNHQPNEQAANCAHILQGWGSWYQNQSRAVADGSTWSVVKTHDTRAWSRGCSEWTSFCWLCLIWCERVPECMWCCGKQLENAALRECMVSRLRSRERWVERNGSTFVRLISHQPTVLFSHNLPVTSNQSAVLFF